MSLTPVPDMTPAQQLVRPVIVRLPRDLGGCEVLVQHYDTEIVVAVREPGQRAWTPAEMAGAEIEVRAS